MFSGYRSSDAVLTVCQINPKKSIEIREINAVAESALGYGHGELLGKPLQFVVAPKVSQLIAEYVEFEDDGNDLSGVLGKMREIALISKDGAEKSFHLKIIRSEATDRNAQFKLILHDQSDLRKQEAFREILQANFKGHEVLDPATGLPDRNSLQKDIELVLYYCNQKQLSACFAVVEVDGFQAIVDRRGAEAAKAVIQQIAHIARQNLRADDTIGTLSPLHLGILLMDITTESARMVLNRLRWLVAAAPLNLGAGASEQVTVSVGFAGIGGRISDKNLLPDVEYFLREIRGQGGNVLMEVGEVEKRKTQDRRQVQIPVEIDRRQGERRRGDG